MMRCLIVDDEPLAREHLRQLVREDARLELVGEAANGIEATELYESLQPDVIFLDIRMPGRSGLDVARRLPDTVHVVFTTAFDDHAVAAFELQAVDYLLKPFTRPRFKQTIDRLVELPPATDSSRIERALRDKGALTKVTVRTRRGYHLIPVDQIRRIEAADDYARLHAESGSYLVSVRMHELEERLPRSRFVRIHRSHIVNLEYVNQIVRIDSGRGEIELETGVTVPASRTGMSVLRPYLDNRPGSSTHESEST